MRFLDKLKPRLHGAKLDPAAQADAEEKDEVLAAPKEAADRELPSVNARKKGSKMTSAIAMLFIGGLGIYLIYQMNTGKDRKQIAAQKKEAQEAQANAITGTLPVISVPDKPLVPNVDGPQPDSAPATPNNNPQPSIAAGQPDQVPAPTGTAPIAVQGQQMGPGGKPVKAPWELTRDRRRLGTLAVKFDGGSGSAPSNSNTDDPASTPGASSYAQQRIAQLQGQINAAGGQQQAAQNGVPGSLFTPGGSGGTANDELGKAMQPTVTKGTVAAKLFDRNYLIPKGTFIDCTLETRIDSTVPGMTSCIQSKNIYSDNGKLVLLDRGSKIVGQYQGGIKQGQARIFVLWTRVQTPTGVVINLDSPGTDALGASGLDGYVDTHFWERFGGAIMLSLIEDGFAAAAQAQSSGSSQTNVSFGNTQSATQNMATEALKSTINIPPTLRKNHGDHINIYVARDLDFRSVYGIRAK